MSVVFGSNSSCEQPFSLMMDVVSRSRSRLTDKHLEGYKRIATEIKPDTEGVLKEKLSQISHWQEVILLKEY
jgi:hypothetical protein